MKFLIGVILGGLALVVSFQNCSQPPSGGQNEVSGSLSQNVSSSTSAKTSLNSENLNVVNFFIQDVQNVVKAGNVFSVKYNKILTIDLASNQVTESSDLDSNPKIFCITDALKNELLSILNASQVCETNPTIQDRNAVCSQVVKQPYAEVVTSHQPYSLGSASDSCGHNSVDLCSADQVQLLKGYIVHLNSIYSSLTCP
ncbi:MAG: hypothetical protein ACXWQQ_14815 [Pseudobdellovibrio sp.]